MSEEVIKMRYKKILRHLSKKENISTKEIEREMKIALMRAGIDCSVEKFLETTVNLLREKTIYSK